LESERIIVRAANLNIFAENESPQQWVNCSAQKAISYFGSVGINTNTPQEALVVNGNVQVTGAVLQPSDRRLKEKITPVDGAKQLENIKRLSLHRYELKDAWAKASGREGSKSELGVLAQELQIIMPDAVQVTSQDIPLENGGVGKNLLLVNKERLFMENIGAVKELARLTAEMERRLRAVERMPSSKSDRDQDPHAAMAPVAAATTPESPIALFGPRAGRGHSILVFLLGMVSMLCIMLMQALFYEQHNCMMMAAAFNTSGDPK